VPGGEAQQILPINHLFSQEMDALSGFRIQTGPGTADEQFGLSPPARWDGLEKRMTQVGANPSNVGIFDIPIFHHSIIP